MNTHPLNMVVPILQLFKLLMNFQLMKSFAWASPCLTSIRADHFNSVKADLKLTVLKSGAK